MKKNVSEWKAYLLLILFSAIVFSTGIFFNINKYKNISTVLQPYPEYKSELSEINEAYYQIDEHFSYLAYNLTFQHNGENVKIASEKNFAQILVEPGIDRPYVIYKYLDNDIGDVKNGYYVISILLPDGFDIEKRW